MKNGSKDLSAFLNEVRGPKSKKSDTAGFSKKNLDFGVLGVFMVKNGVFRTFLENGSNDFAHFAYLDRLGRYLQLLY